MFVVGLFLSLLLIVSPLYADVTADHTLGTIVDPSYNTDVNEYLISGGQYIGNENRGNLFHSFEQFSLESFEDAIFLDEGLFVDNIITRVTGGESNINGGIISKIAGANLYFLNPNGIIFGESAYLDIDGSVYMSTANSLTLDDNTVFHTADFSQDHLLSIASPYAFGFLSNPAPISASDAYLQMYAGTELALIGGNINLEYSSLEAFSGTISLVSVGSEGQVIFDEETGTYTNVDSFEKLGDITLVDYKLFPLLDEDGLPIIDEETGEVVFDEEIDLGSVNVSGDIGGNVFIRAENFVITDFAKIYATAYDSIDFSATPAFVDIDARGDVTISNDSKIDVSGSAGGNIFIQANNLVMTDYGEIYADIGDEYRTHSDAPDKASVIDIDVNHDIAIVNSSGIEASNFDDSTEGASVYIRAQNLEISGFKDDNPDNDPSAISIGESSNFSDSKAGTIKIDVNTFNMNDEAFIEADANGSGSAGNINIIAKESIKMDGAGYITTAVGYEEKLLLGNIDEETGDEGYLEYSGLGDAGNIDIDAPLLSLNNGVIISSGADEQTQAQAGNIEITADVLRLQEFSRIYSFNDGDGNGGFVNITANEAILKDSDLYLYALNGIGGDINFNISSNGYLYMENSFISASSEGQHTENKGGNINLSNPAIFILNKSHLHARAYEGEGGNIRLNAGYFLHPPKGKFYREITNNEFNTNLLPLDIFDILIAEIDNGISRVDSSSNFGQQGNIQVDAFEEDFSKFITKLPLDYKSIDMTTNKCLPPKDAGQLIIFEKDRSTL